MRQLPDPWHVYNHGLRFLKADDHMRRSCAQDAALINSLIFPAMTLSAFAAELFLKSLLIVEGTTPPGSHNSNTLFKRLHNKTKEALRIRWDGNVAAREKELAENERRLDVQIPRDLDTALADCGDAFEKMRYLYEDPINVKFYITDLAGIVRDHIIVVRPDWR